VITGSSNIRVTHMLYADDLCLTANRADQMQTMLDLLDAYAKRKELTINAFKSEVDHFQHIALASLLSVCGVLC